MKSLIKKQWPFDFIMHDLRCATVCWSPENSPCSHYWGPEGQISAVANPVRAPSLGRLSQPLEMSKLDICHIIFHCQTPLDSNIISNISWNPTLPQALLCHPGPPCLPPSGIFLLFIHSCADQGSSCWE